MKLIVRWIIIALALFVAAWLIPGIRVEGDALGIYILMALILGLVNAIIRPIIKFISLPITILTLGLFIFVINGITFWLASSIAARWFHVGFYVEGFRSALLGALVVSIVSVILTALTKEED